MSKRKIWGVCIAITSIIIVVCLICCLNYGDDVCSDFEKALAANANAEFIDMPPERSELFSVEGRHDGSLWRIALIEGEEIFFTTFSTSEDAEECYWASIGQCEENSLFLCGNDVIYYRGDNMDTLQILQQFSPIPPKR